MKRLFVLIFFAFAVQPAMSQAILKPVDESSKVGFTIKNFGLNVGGNFKGLKGSIRFDPAKPEESEIDVTVDANSINTDNTKRDNHLRQEEYFNVAKFPVLQVKSIKVSGSATTGYTMDGNITIKGVSKKISIPFKAAAQNGGYLFTGEFEISRRDFEVGGKSAVMSDNLKVSLSIFAK